MLLSSVILSVERFLMRSLYMLPVCLGALTTGWNWSPPEERTCEVPNVPDTYSCSRNLLRKHCKGPDETNGGECHSQGIYPVQPQASNSNSSSIFPYISFKLAVRIWCYIRRTRLIYSCHYCRGV